MPVAFSRIRIAGFKSFADPVSVEILPGLTGIVGPNGCGKSNVVEALRWAMGENSARSLRGGEMDDVIFAGTAHRASRNLAEVVITLEDALGLAPPPFADAAELQISRRIERGAGSAYRVNGKDARARDVQTLFADLASGARASAMVSQGRIGALVNARPDERRAILEEAAGITGLHARRHEAELKLRAAEANLTRAEDLKLQLESQLDGLKRQARQAARYRNISGLVRQAEADWLGLLHARADTALTVAQQSLHEAAATARAAGAEAEQAIRASHAAEQELAAPREQEALARSALERRRFEAEGLEAEESRARQALEQAQSRRETLLHDVREAEGGAEDATQAEARLMAEQADLNAAEASLPARLHAAQDSAVAATRHVAQMAAEADAAMEAAAAAAARAGQAQAALAAAEERSGRIQAQHESLVRDRDQALAEQVAAGPLDASAKRVEEEEAALALARETFDAAETARIQAGQDAESSRQARIAAEADHRRLQGEREAAGQHLQRVTDQLRQLRLDLDAAEAGQVGPERIEDAARAQDSAESALREAEESLRGSESQRAEHVRLAAESRQGLAAADSARQHIESQIRVIADRRQKIADQLRALQESLQAAEAARIPEQSLRDSESATVRHRAALDAARQVLEQREADRIAAAERLAAAQRDLAGADANAARAETDLAAAANRLSRLREQEAGLAAEIARLEARHVPEAALAAAAAALRDAEAALAQARHAHDAADARQTEAAQAMADAHTHHAATEAARARLRAEIEGLSASLATQHEAGGPPAIDAIAVPPGLEAAFGAALGEAIESALEDGNRFWRGLPPLPASPLPGAARPLTDLAEIPPGLHRALHRIGLLPDGTDGAALQAELAPGQALVTRDGGRWRWDGHVVRPGAAGSGAARLEQRNRLRAADARLADLAGEAERAQTALETATTADADARAALTRARLARQALDAPLQASRDHESALRTEAAHIASQWAALDTQRQRLAVDRTEAETAQAQAQTARDALPAADALRAAYVEAGQQDQHAATAESGARQQRRQCEADLQAAREAHAALMARAAEADSHVRVLSPQLHRLTEERAGTEQALSEAEQHRTALPDIGALRARSAAADQAEAKAAADEQAARQNRQNAETALASARQTLAALQTRDADAATRALALRPQLDRVTAERDRLATQIRQLDATIGGLPDLAHAQAAGAEADARLRDAQHNEATARDQRQQADTRLAEARTARAELTARAAEAEGRLTALLPQLQRVETERTDAAATLEQAREAVAAVDDLDELRRVVDEARARLDTARQEESARRGEQDGLRAEQGRIQDRSTTLAAELRDWHARRTALLARLHLLQDRQKTADAEHDALAEQPDGAAERRRRAGLALQDAEQAHRDAAARLQAAEQRARETAEARHTADIAFAAAREAQLRADGARGQAAAALDAVRARVAERLGDSAALPTPAELTDAAEDRARRKLDRLGRERDEMGPVNLRAEIELAEIEGRIAGIDRDRDELGTAIAKLRGSIGHLNREGRDRLNTVFADVDRHFQTLFARMFGGGRAHLALVGSDDPLLAGLEIYAQPPGKKLATLSLLSGGEQALTALSLIFAVFRCNPAPICVLDEVDAPLDDANVERFCTLLADMVRETGTRFLVVTHHQVTMAHMNQLYGVTMQERGVSRVLSVNLARAAAMVDQPRVAAE